MAVNEDLSAYSTTAASNTPAGSSNIGPDLDNHLRDIKRNIRRVAERYQGATTPEAFRGRDWVDTSGTASNKLELTMNDGTNEVPYIQIDTSAGTSTPLVHGTAIPTGSMAVQAANAVNIDGGTIDGTPIGGTTPAAGDFAAITSDDNIQIDPATGAGYLSAFGHGTAPTLNGYRSEGTKASPTAMINNATALQVAAYGYDGVSNKIAGRLSFKASENWSVGNNGMDAELSTTPNGSATTQVSMHLKEDGTVGFLAGLMLQSGQTLLDQYDEGTFSVGVDDGAGNSATLSSSCVYTRIGNEVSFRISITLTSKGSMTSGNAVRITGMPFSAASTDDGGAVSYAESLSLGANVALTYKHSSDTLNLWKWDTSGGPTSFKVSNLTDSTVLSISGKYFV